MAIQRVHHIKILLRKNRQQGQGQAKCKEQFCHGSQIEKGVVKVGS
jgi:hypothetical protein